MSLKRSHRVWLAANGDAPWPCAWTCGQPVQYLGGDHRDRDRGIVHHDDRNPRNDAEANLRAMHHRCHVALHRPARLYVPLNIDLRSPVPSYRQLADQIAAAIAGASETVPLPSLTELHSRTGLALATVQHAIKVLTADGLVYSVSGRGTFVKG